MLIDKKQKKAKRRIGYILNDSLKFVFKHVRQNKNKIRYSPGKSAFISPR